ncbi:hypothetical protein N6H14_31760 [Paenibacillus sp. CC-CFT747]|nr:hypothetical protein N6H14_31760 [Paenibacillus sp. CC-CFT747]
MTSSNSNSRERLIRHQVPFGTAFDYPAVLAEEAEQHGRVSMFTVPYGEGKASLILIQPGLVRVRMVGGEDKVKNVYRSMPWEERQLTISGSPSATNKRIS